MDGIAKHEYAAADDQTRIPVTPGDFRYAADVDWRRCDFRVAADGRYLACGRGRKHLGRRHQGMSQAPQDDARSARRGQPRHGDGGLLLWLLLTIRKLDRWVALGRQPKSCRHEVGNRRRWDQVFGNIL